MRRLSNIELCGLGLGAVFFLMGAAWVFWPQPGIIWHFTNDVLGLAPRSEMEEVSSSGARAYGVLGMVLGAGLVWMALYHEKR